MAEWSNALVSGTHHFYGVSSNPTSIMLHCYKSTVLSTKKQFENNKQHTFNCIDCIDSMSEWSKAWIRIPLLSCYTITNQHFYLPRNNLRIISNIPSTVLTILAAWLRGVRHWLHVPIIPKADVLTATPVILHCYKFGVLLAKRHFENNKQHTYNGIDYIGRITERSKAMVSSTRHFHGAVLKFIFLLNH